MTHHYPRFFDGAESKQASAVGFLRGLAGKALSGPAGRQTAWNWFRRGVGAPMRQSIQINKLLQPKTWGGWAADQAKGMAGMLGVTMAGDAVLNGLGFGGSQAPAQAPDDQIGLDELQLAMNHPDPNIRMIAQHYAQRNGLMVAPQAGGYYQQPPGQELMSMLSSPMVSARRDPYAGTFAPSAQTPAQAPAQPASPQIVYVPMREVGSPPVAAAAAPKPVAANPPAVGQPPAPPARPAPTQVAARPAIGQPPRPVQSPKTPLASQPAKAVTMNVPKPPQMPKVASAREGKAWRPDFFR